MKKIKLFINQFPRHWFVAANAWISKIIVSLVQIVSIRVLLDYLGEDRYVVYVISFSLIGWFNLAEFSVGVSLQNFISELRAKNENYEAYLIATLQTILILFILSMLFMAFISNPVQSIIYIKFTHIPEIHNTNIVLAVGIISIITTLLNVVYRIYYALHKGYIPNIMPSLAAITSMILIVFLNRYTSRQHSILSALLIFMLPQLILALIPFVKIFKNYFSKILLFNFQIFKSLFIRSIKFHGISILGIASMQTDYLIMSQTLKPNEIVIYNIFMRVFMFFSFMYTSLLAAFWPISAEMYVNKKFEDIKKTIKKYLIYVTLFMIAGTISVLIFSGFITKILAPGLNIIPAISLLLLFGFYVTIRSWHDTLATFLQSISALRIFWIYMPFQFIISVCMQYFLSKKYGVEGIVLGLISSIIFVSLWVLPLKTHKILNNKE